MVNEDQIAEILSHVEGEHLTRFQLVSKAWHGLISTHPRLRPCFDWGLCITTLDETTRRRRVTFKRSSDEGGLEDDKRLSFSFPGDMDVLDSCNGLLLIGMPMSVYDPVSRQRTDLPPPCQPDLPIVFTGLAVDSPHNYSVVRALTEAKEDMCNGANVVYFEVYSSETREWTTKAEAFVEISPDGFQALDGMVSRALYLDGALHWIVAGNLLVYRLKDACSIVVQFDDSTPVLPCLVEMEGKLHFVGGLVEEAGSTGVHISEILFSGDPEDEECEFVEWNHKSLIEHADIDSDLLKLADLEPVGYNERLRRVYLKVQGWGIVSCTCSSDETGSQKIHTEVVVASVDVCKDNYNILPFKCSSTLELKGPTEALDDPRQKRSEV